MTKTTQHILHEVQHKMDVFDVNNNKIGAVETLHFGEEGAVEPTTTAADKQPVPSFVKNFAEALDGATHFNEEIQNRLRRHGFIRVERGILRSDGFIFAENIQKVDDEGVHLDIAKDDILTR